MRHPSPITVNKPGMVVQACHSSYTGNKGRRISLQTVRYNIQDPTRKIIQAKRIGEIAQVVECLPSKLKALCSNPSSAKNKKQTTKGKKPKEVHLVFENFLWHGF
jgi:hypothetical protein